LSDAGFTIGECFSEFVSDLPKWRFQSGARLRIGYARLQPAEEGKDSIVVSLQDRITARRRIYELWRHHDWRKNVRRFAHLGAKEFRWRHADNRERQAGQTDRFADDGGIGAEPAAPINVAGDRDGRRAGRPIIIGAKEPADSGVDTQDREVGAGNQMAKHSWLALTGYTHTEPDVRKRRKPGRHLIELSHNPQARKGIFP